MFKRAVLAVLTLALPSHAALLYTFSYTSAFGGTSIVKSFSFSLTLPGFYTSAANDGPLPAFTPFNVTDTNMNTFTITKGRADWEFGFMNECFTFASASGSTLGNCGGTVGTGSILLASFLPPVSMTGGPYTPNIFQGNFGANPADYINGSPGTGSMSLTVGPAPPPPDAGVPEPSSIWFGVTGLFGLACYGLARSRKLRAWGSGCYPHNSREAK